MWLRNLYVKDDLGSGRISVVVPSTWYIRSGSGGSS